MAPHDLRRPFKRPLISDQEKRRQQSLLRQAQNRRDAQDHARFLATTTFSLEQQNLPEHASELELDIDLDIDSEHPHSPKEFDVVGASKLKGAEARKWFAKQLTLPEWMIDIPENLSQDWFVLARPSGKRCFVVSCDGITMSRLKNGSILHRFPSALPNGSRKRDVSGPSQSYSILDCIFHEVDQTYYVIDMVCWRGYSLYDCAYEFRFFWLKAKLGETGACDPPSYYHKYRFSLVPAYSCDQSGLSAAYSMPAPYVKDGLLFYNKHAHYQAGVTPLALVWKDENCSQYVLDTDSKGQVPNQQQVVLELQEDGKLATSDDSPVVFGCLDGNFMQQSDLHSGCLVRFAIGEGGLVLIDGKLQKADLNYLGKANRARASADSFSKVMFQYSVRHSPLRIDDLFGSVSTPPDEASKPCDIEMDG